MKFFLQKIKQSIDIYLKDRSIEISPITCGLGDIQEQKPETLSMHAFSSQKNQYKND